MNRKKLLFILVCLFLWTGFYVQAEAGRSSSLDHTIEQKKLVALSFLKNNQFDAAYNSYMSLLREDPTDDEINYGLMLSAYHLKNYTAALLAGERLVDKYPADANLRLHMARTYLALEERESAKYELEEARRYNPDISPDQVDDILKSLERSDKRLFINGSISTGIIYDTNSNQGPSSNTLNLGIFDGLVVDGVKSKESWGSYLGTNLDLSYRLGENSPWWLVSDLAIYQRWNTSAGIQTNNQFTWGRVAAGVRRVGEKSMIDFRINHNQGLQTHKIGEDELVHSGGPELMLIFFPHPDLQFISSFSWELRDYKVSDGRDGQYWTVSQYARYFFGEKRHYVMVGASFSGTDTYIQAYNHKTQEPYLTFKFNLPFDLSFSPRISYRHEEYSGPATGLEINNREDEQVRVGANLAWNISDSLTFDIDYQHINNKSNSELYVYKQDVVRSGLTFKF